VRREKGDQEAVAIRGKRREIRKGQCLHIVRGDIVRLVLGQVTALRRLPCSPTPETAEEHGFSTHRPQARHLLP
jgi:hypothetical protein